MIVLLILLSLAVSFLLTSGLVWLLPALGITAIGTFVIVFSWKLALAVWIILVLLQSIFSVGSKG